MRMFLDTAAEMAIMAIDSMALLVILIGTIEAFISGLRTMLMPGTSNHAKREVWARYGRWLVAGLTFQLAADIIETSIAPQWEDIGRLAAIAAIRTALNFFLERDLVEVQEHKQRSNPAA